MAKGLRVGRTEGKCSAGMGDHPCRGRACTQVGCCGGPGHPWGAGCAFPASTTAEAGGEHELHRRRSHVLLEHPIATAGRKTHGWLASLVPQPPGLTPYSQGKTRSLSPYPRSPLHSVNYLRQASGKHPSLPLAALPSVGSGRALRRQEPSSRLQSKSSSSCNLPPRLGAMSPRAERFNHSFPKTFSSEHGLHRSARSLIFPLCSLHSSFFPSPDRLSSPTPQVSSLGLEHSRNHYRQRPPYQQSPSG